MYHAHSKIQQGFGLIEIIISLIVIAMGVLLLARSQVQILHQTSIENSKIVALITAKSAIDLKNCCNLQPHSLQNTNSVFEIQWKNKHILIKEQGSHTENIIIEYAD